MNVARSPARSTDHPYVATQGAAARVYGISVKHLQQLIRSKGCPGKARGGYDLFAMGKWFSENSDRFERRADDAPEPGSVAALRNRKVAAETGLAEIELDEARRKYCLRTDVERVAREALTTARLLLEAMPLKFSLLVPPEFRGDVEREAKDSIRTALRTLKTGLARTIDEECPPDLPDPWPAIFERLDKVPAAVAGVVTGEKAQVAAERVGKKWMDEVRQAIADVVECSP